MAKYRIQSKSFADGLGPLMTDANPTKAGLSLVPGGEPAIPKTPAAPVPFKPEATGANVESLSKTKDVFNRGVNQGKNSVGAWQGMKNSWGKMGTAGKAGVIGAGVLGAGLMANGLFGGSGSNKQAAFSEDTGQSVSESLMLGGGLLAAGGGIALAKRGKLGFTKNQKLKNKTAYENVVKKFKTVWNETGKKPKKFETTVQTETKPGQATKVRTETRRTANVPPKKDFELSKKDFERVRNELIAEGKHINKNSIIEMATKLGIKPLK